MAERREKKSTDSKGLFLRKLKGPAGVVLVFIVFLSVYAYTGRNVVVWGHARHYVHLAQAMLEGRLDLGAEPFTQVDMTNMNGTWYVAFPPLPAVILLPFTAAFGLKVKEQLISYVFGALNCVFMWIIFKRIPVKLTMSRRIGLTVLFGLGTVHWYNVLSGAVWHFAHVIAVFFLLLYIIECLGRKRPVAAGAALGLAGLCRTAVWFGFPFYLGMMLNETKKEKAPPSRRFKKVILFGAALSCALALTALYNYFRFGAPLEFGYSGMNIALRLNHDLNEYGLFDLHFLKRNLYHFLIAPPEIIKAGYSPYIEPDYWGNGLLFVSPALLFFILGLRFSPLSIGAFLSALFISLPNLTYYNTGWMQFGYRFVLDFLPFLMILTAIGLKGKLWKIAVIFIVLSVFANFWGFHWFHKVPLFGFQMWTD